MIMTLETMLLGAPPFQLTWRSNTLFSTAVPGNDSLYGITPAGKLVALRATDGAVRWESNATYLTHRLVRSGSRLLAFRSGEGLGYIDDLGGGAPTETLAVSFSATTGVNISTIVTDNRMLYYTVNLGLYATHQEEGLLFGTVLNDVQPHAVGLIAPGALLVVNGKGVPSRYQVTETAFELVWEGEPHGIDAGQTERPFVISGNRVVISVGPDTVAYDLNTGRVAWRLVNLPVRAFATWGGIVYGAFHGAALWAIRASDGAVLWQGQYLVDVSLQREYGLALVGDHLIFGGALVTNPDRAIILAARAGDGAFAWLSRAATGTWAGGIPISDGVRLFCYGSNHTGAYGVPTGAVRVTPDRIVVSPRPLRGRASGFGSGTVRLTLPGAATVNITAYRERQGAGTRILSNANLGAGTHERTWNQSTSGGFSDAAQFGYILVDIAESGGLRYTQSHLVPVNTFPDILWHWGRASIEAMIYHKHVSGYPDQTFKPNNLVTRAESSTIIAKTLGLEGPSAGFATRFTDIATHWARASIMALEERGIIGGFAEPDGTFTFKPDLNMNRAQEARILVNGYSIAAAPAGFATSFTDIAGHWAEADIKALEAAGYINGFREPNGTFTYRPEQSLTRAELCTVVVRILGLSR